MSKDRKGEKFTGENYSSLNIKKNVTRRIEQIRKTHTVFLTFILPGHKLLVSHCYFLRRNRWFVRKEKRGMKKEEPKLPQAPKDMERE